MQTVIGERGIWIGAQARLVDSGDITLRDWAERRVRSDPDLGWIVGNFVEADVPNSNGHLFPLPALQTAIGVIQDKALNWLHQSNYIVGHYADANFGDLPLEASEATTSTIIEALACFYRLTFADEYAEVQKAHDQGSLFFSMECQSPTVTCPTAYGGCGGQYVFAGRYSDSYCEHLQQPKFSTAKGPRVPIQVDQPHFQAGAIILPPVKPGWNRANITEFAAWQEEHVDDAEHLYNGLKVETGLPDVTLETLMAEIVGLRAEVTGYRAVVDAVAPMAMERLVSNVLTNGRRQ